MKAGNCYRWTGRYWEEILPSALPLRVPLAHLVERITYRKLKRAGALQK